uniref:IclR family transcriptional regulator C-terminal domain-containing protein n=1 Tax=Granulicoccus phenolivorans TaxID=266854 RepID=UPI0003FDF62B|nr:IclR family transcriptional regulator C-terminal domain-containing protein [Granulicoccus phenolivorans]
MLLAHASAELLDRILGQPLRAYTMETITDPDQLRAELSRSRSSGTAVVHDELTPGATSYATRIVNGDGRVVAARSVVVRSGSIKEHAILPALVTSGLNISRLLGWEPTTRLRLG